MSEPTALAAAPLNRLFRMAAWAGVEASVLVHIRRGDDLNARDPQGLTPLMIAASRDKAGVCSLLIEAGADSSLLDAQGRDALALAKSANAVNAIRALAARFVGTATADLPSSSHAEEPHAAAESVSTGKQDEPPEAESSPADANSAAMHSLAAEIAGEPTSAVEADAAEEGGEGAFDLSGWIPEVADEPPSDEPAVAIEAAAIQAAISDHSPIDTSERWDDVDVFLPARAARVPRSDDEEARKELRLLLLRALREGSVPASDVERLCVDDDPAVAESAHRALLMILNDLGADADERFEFVSFDDDFSVTIDPAETEDEEEALDEALDLLDDIESRRSDPLRHYMRDAKSKLIGAEEEVALAKSMESHAAAALEALASWPAGLASVLAAARLVAEGAKPLRWLSSGLAEREPPSAATDGVLDFDPSVADSSAALAAARADDAPSESGEGAAAGADNQDEDEDDAAQFLAGATELAASQEAGPLPERALSALRRMSIQRSWLIELGSSSPRTHSAEGARFSRSTRELSKARDRFVEANLKLAYSIAKRYMGSGLPLDDLLQEANIGLIKGVDKFDWRRGFKFSTMATWWIRQQVSRSVADTALLIRLPAHAYEAANALHREARAWEARTGDAPTHAQLADALGLRQSKVDAYMLASSPPMELDAIESDPTTLVQAQGDPITAVAQAHLARALGRMLDGLGAKPA